MADDKDFTPNGCRIDNGRCFALLEWDDAEAAVRAVFHDGSEYLYHGLGKADAEDWIAMVDPGCFFNMNIWPGTFTKVHGPTK